MTTRELFNTTILGLYATLLITNHVVLELLVEEENSPFWNATRKSAGLAAKNVTREIARFASVGYSLLDSVDERKFWKSADLLDATIEAVYDIEVNIIDAVKQFLAEGGSGEKIVYTSCQLVIEKREEIFQAVANMKEPMELKLLTTEEIDYICQQLTSFSEEILPLQLYNYFLGVERILTILGRADKHKTFLENFSLPIVRTCYYNLFEPIFSRKVLDDLLLPTTLPMELVDIIFNYCTLDCLDPLDRKLICDRILDKITFPPEKFTKSQKIPANNSCLPSLVVLQI